MKMQKSVLTLAMATALVIMFGMVNLSLAAEEKAKEEKKQDSCNAIVKDSSCSAAVKDSTDEKKISHLYGNHLCPVSGEPVDPESFYLYENKDKGIYARIYLCCQGCEKKVEKTPAETYGKLYLTDPKTGNAIEPRDLKNEKCPISGEPVDPKVKIEYNGMIVHFCCQGCVKEFLTDPESELEKLLPKADEFKFDSKAGSHKM